MDEYADERGRAIPSSHPLSFRRLAQELFFDRLSPANGLQQARVFFPTDENLAEMAAAMTADGGVECCFGGIGIHGHVAFNEPGSGVAELGLRLAQLCEHTVTLATLRAGVGGNLTAFPKQAYTLGLREIRAARHIRLYARQPTALGLGEDGAADGALRRARGGLPGHTCSRRRRRPSSLMLPRWNHRR